MPLKKRLQAVNAATEDDWETLPERVAALYRMLEYAGGECASLGLKDTAAMLQGTARDLLAEYRRQDGGDKGCRKEKPLFVSGPQRGFPGKDLN